MVASRVSTVLPACPLCPSPLISIHLRVLKGDPEIRVHLVLVNQPCCGTGTKP